MDSRYGLNNHSANQDPLVHRVVKVHCYQLVGLEREVKNKSEQELNHKNLGKIFHFPVNILLKLFFNLGILKLEREVIPCEGQV